MVGRWNILDRGVRPLVVRSDGTFTLFDHREGRTDGRWLRVSDTFVSLFVDGPKRHSMYSMPDGRVFLSRYAPPGTDSTPELVFRAVLSFEGTWETPYRASLYTPAPPTWLSLGADRTFCADLGPTGEDAAVVWSGIWARTDDRTATLDYVAWSVADGVRRMTSHGHTTLELRDDGSMLVVALGEAFYPAPGTVRAEDEDPLATAEEPEVLVGASVVAPDRDETAGPSEASDDEAPASEVPEAPGPETPAAQDSVVIAPAPETDAAPGRRRARRPRAARSASARDAVGTVELPPADGTAAQSPSSPQDAAATEPGPVGPADATDLAAAPVVQDGSLVDVPDGVVDGSLVPVARTTADDGTQVVVVLYVGTDGALRVGALPAPAGTVGDQTTSDHVPTDLADQPAGSPVAAPAPQGVPQTLPVAVTTVDDGTQVVVVLYADRNGDLQVGAVPAAGPGSPCQGLSAQ